MGQRCTTQLRRQLLIRLFLCLIMVAVFVPTVVTAGALIIEPSITSSTVGLHQDQLDDPYAVFRVHYQATGGLHRWQAVQSSYSAGKLRCDALHGNFKLWQQEPLQSRLEEDYTFIRQIYGDSGDISWHFDHNGQVDLFRDPATLQRRQLAKYLSKFEHLNRQSTIFTLTLEDSADIGATACYVVRLDNTINSDVIRYYFAIDTLYLIASVTTQPDIEISSRYADFRQVDGLIMPFYQKDDIAPRQKQRETWLTTVKINPHIDAQLFAVPVAEPPKIIWSKNGAVAESTGVEIPFKFMDGAIYLPVTLGSNSGWWVLDSGASNTVIDADYAQSLHLPAQGQIKGFGFGANFDLSFVKLPPMVVGQDKQIVQVAPHYATSYRGLTANSYEPKINGIIGYDFLSRFMVRIDYASKTLTLYDAKTDPPLPWLDAPLKYRMFTVPVTIDGALHGRWSVDLGAERTSFHYPYVQNNSRLRQLSGGVESVSKGLAGYLFSRLYRFHNLQIGDVSIDDPVISVPDKATHGSTTIGELAGNLGSSVLRNFVIWLDYSRQRICLQPGALLGEPIAEDRSGMLVGMSDNNQPMISFVATTGPVAQAGFIAGDLIVAIDGKKVDEFSGVHEIRQLLCGDIGVCFTFVLQRGAETVTLKLCLEKLL